jgi:hypothetical protein
VDGSLSGSFLQCTWSCGSWTTYWSTPAGAGCDLTCHVLVVLYLQPGSRSLVTIHSLKQSLPEWLMLKSHAQQLQRRCADAIQATGTCAASKYGEWFHFGCKGGCMAL